MALPVVKGPKHGRCNSPEKIGKPRHFQRGVKFRTTCISCNRDVLGSLYDKALIKLSNDVSAYLFSQISRPARTSFNTQPGLVARAVFGHIMAIGVGCFPRGQSGDVMAKCVLNPCYEISNQLKLYYWLYPFWDQVLIRGMSMMVRLGSPPIFVSLINFMPFAFLVAWDPDPRIRFPYPNLCDYIKGEYDDYADIPLDLGIVPRQHYPEMPTGEGIALHGRDAFRATRL